MILGETHQGGAALLLVFDGTAKARKLVVRVGCRMGKAGEINLVKTGGEVDVTGMRSRIGMGYTLIDGVL